MRFDNKKIGVLSTGLLGWGGGAELLRLVTNSLTLAGSRRLGGVVLIEDDSASFVSRARSSLSLIRRARLEGLSAFKRGFASDKRSQAISVQDVIATIDEEVPVTKYNGTFYGLKRASVEQGIGGVILSTRILGRKFPIPWVGYLADLQYKSMPHNFSIGDRSYLEDYYQRMLSESRAIVVNSIATANDIKKYFPSSRAEIFALPFAPQLSKALQIGGNEVHTLIGVEPHRYFLISNQFWVHKDHLTAFRALAEFYRLGGDSDIKLVCTGVIHDSRFPTYFDKLLDDSIALGLKGQLIFTGYVPKVQQIGLMREAISIIQPTLFEGGPGGGSVYDAVALGVPAIVSDIAVNREIDEGNIHFFAAGSPKDLAKKMLIAIDAKREILPDDLLLQASKQRAMKMADVLMSALEYAGFGNGEN